MVSYSWMSNMSKAVLIVDDSPLMRKIIRRGFSEMDESWVFHEAENGVVGLEKLKLNHVNLIFSDINMPVMDGLEFVNKVRANEDYRRIPIVMVTSEGNEEFLEISARLGANGYIQKPFTPKKLKLIIESINLS